MTGITDNSAQALISLDDIPHLRVTQIATFADCPASFKARLLGAGANHNSPAARIGTAAHLAVEYFLQDKAAEPQPFALKWMPYLTQEGMSEEEQYKLLQYLKTLEEYRPHLLATEYEFTVPLIQDAPPVRGHIDAIIDLGDEGILLLDHKTNRQFDPESFWRRQLQPRFYTAAAHQLWPGRSVQFEIGYPNLGRKVRWKPSSEEVLDAFNHYEQVWDEIRVYRRTGEWPERINRGCRWCPVANTCKAMQAQVQAIWSDKHDLLAEGTPLVERYERAAAILKALEQIVCQLKAAMLLHVEHEGGLVRGAQNEFVIQRRKRRHADFVALWNALWEIVGPEWVQQPALAATISSRLSRMFSVNLGIMDEVADTYPPLREMMERVCSTIEGEPYVTARALRGDGSEETV